MTFGYPHLNSRPISCEAGDNQGRNTKKSMWQYFAPFELIWSLKNCQLSTTKTVLNFCLKGRVYECIICVICRFCFTIQSNVMAVIPLTWNTNIAFTVNIYVPALMQMTLERAMQLWYPTLWYSTQPNWIRKAFHHALWHVFSNFVIFGGNLVFS